MLVLSINVSHIDIINLTHHLTVCYLRISSPTSDETELLSIRIISDYISYTINIDMIRKWLWLLSSIKSTGCLRHNSMTALSQRRICRAAPPLRSSHPYIKDGECTESNKKSCFRFFRFFIFRVMVIIWSFCAVITPSFDGFFTITRKIKIGKCFYYLSRSIQHSPYLS